MIPSPETQNSEQRIQNKSYDKDHDIIAIQMIGFDGTNLTRVQVTSTGELVVTV